MLVLLGVMGVVVGIVRAVPQLVRLLRKGASGGVSLDTLATTALLSLGWVAYGSMTDQVVLMAATGVSCTFFTVAASVARAQGQSERRLRGAPVLLCLLVATAWVVGSSGLPWLLALTVVMANAPQAVAAGRGVDVVGVSRGTWWLSVADGAVWGAFAILSSIDAMMVYGALQVGSSAVVLVRVQRGRDGIVKPKAREVEA